MLFPDADAAGACAPRVFGLAPGTGFARRFAEALRARSRHLPPEAIARIGVIANSARAARDIGAALAEVFAPGPLPQVLLLTDLADHPDAPPVPPAVDGLRRQLRPSELVRAFLESTGSFAPVSARFDLADSLATLLDEMQGWNVPAARLDALDVAEHSAHWQTTLTFLRIVMTHWPELRAEAEPGRIDPEARQRQVVEGLLARWQEAPPADPLIVAGSTASRAVTAELMRAVARLPQGALVLPGFDFDMPGPVWQDLPADHPQANLGALIAGLDLAPEAVQPWDGTGTGAQDSPLPGADPARTRLLSLALRPAPVTDAWRLAIPQVAAEAGAATAGMALIEAETAREEALALALAIRERLEDPQARIALVTPDRHLARMVTAALERWQIRPDDSAGRPLSLTARGIFLRLVARLAGGPAPADALIALLKHPLCGGEGLARRDHMLLVSMLERSLRREAQPVVGPEWLADWAEARRASGSARTAPAWAAWLGTAIAPLAGAGPAELTQRLARVRAAAEALSAGVGGGPARVWDRGDGEAAARLFDMLADQEPVGAELEAADLSRLLDERMQAENVPPWDPGEAPDRRVTILGTLEARMLSADLVLLGGLNDGVWPALPGADPWLSRPMRKALGLALPERQVGLQAHDFQIGAAAPEVILSRAKRVEGTPTIAARWLIRLTNLLEGSGPPAIDALGAMQARGARLVTMARSLDRPGAPVPPATRPAPCPPAEARPRQLSVTRIETLIRDPYAIYARHVLRLRPLDPLGRLPDARDRGRILHRVMERFVEETRTGLPADPEALFLRLADEEIDAGTPWAAQRRLWRGQMARAAPFFLKIESALRTEGTPLVQEVSGHRDSALPGGTFTLTTKADRIDRRPDGSLAVLDYKTGTPPSEKEMRVFARQLWLEAAIAEAGGLSGVPAAPVSELAYIGLNGSGEGGQYRQVAVAPGAVAESWEAFEALIAHYDRPDTPYVARLRPRTLTFEGEYDHLARCGEWDDGESGE